MERQRGMQSIATRSNKSYEESLTFVFNVLKEVSSKSNGKAVYSTAFAFFRGNIDRHKT